MTTVCAALIAFPGNFPLSDIALLYRIETEARKQALSHAARAELRQRDSVPILERLYEQFKRIAQSELPQSRLGKAAAYALARWETLTLYAEPALGHVLIDQNSVERGIRPTKMGQRTGCTSDTRMTAGAR